MIEGSGSIGRSSGVEGSGGLISPGFPGSQENLSCRGSGGREFHGNLLGFMEVEAVIKEKVWVGFHVQNLQ